MIPWFGLRSLESDETTTDAGALAEDTGATWSPFGAKSCLICIRPDNQALVARKNGRRPVEPDLHTGVT